MTEDGDGESASMEALWAFVQRVAASPDGEESVDERLARFDGLQQEAQRLLTARSRTLEHEDTHVASNTAAATASTAAGDVTSTDAKQQELYEKANERVARRMLERTESHGDDSEDKSDTMSDCTTITEASSVYGIQNTWVDLALLYSLPFVASESSGSASNGSRHHRLKPVPALNIAQEQNSLNKIFQECQRAIHTMRAAATVDSLRKVLDRGVTVLHFSGHGGRIAGKTDCLLFEDTQRTGLAHFIDAATLRSILNGGVASGSASPPPSSAFTGLAREDSAEDDGASADGHSSTRSIASSYSRIGLGGTLKLVFVSSCHSKEVGEVFIQAGVQHVVCVRSGDKILDDASAMFSYAFYHAVLAGKTIYQAFEIARVRVSADMQIPDHEGDKFILLESSQVHADSCPLYDSSSDDTPYAIEVNFASNPCTCHASTMHFVFSDISAGKWVDVSPANRFSKTLPAIPESFVGREQELHMLAGLVNSQRFVTMRGPPGIGKSTLSIRLAHFLAERNVFPDGVAFIRLRGVQSLEGVETAIKSALFPDGGREKELPLQQTLAEMKVLLVMDNMEDPINANPLPVREFLLHLLQNTPNLAFLMTARQAMGGGIAGFDEKVVSLNRLSHFHAADLFLKKSPRALLLSEIGDIDAKASTHSRTASVLEALTSHPLMAFLDGHPQAISLCAPLLQDRSLSELTRAVLSRGVSELQVVGLAANDRSAMNTLVTSLDVSLEQVRLHHGSDAIRFFALLGLLPAGAMPADFKSLWGNKWEVVVETLLRFSLIQRNRIPGFVLSSTSRGLPSQTSRRSSSRLSSSRHSSSRHSSTQTYDVALLTALKSYGDFISSASATGSAKGADGDHSALTSSSSSRSGFSSERNLLNTFTRSGRAARVAEHVEKMDNQAEVMAVCVSYSTFPFITSYARSLLGLYDGDGAKNAALESICVADRDRFLYNTARHFWKVSSWIFQYICTLTARSSAAYLILDMHESNLWMLLDLHIRMMEEWRQDSEASDGGDGFAAAECSPEVLALREKTSSYVVDVACFFAHTLFLSGRHRGAWNAVNKALHIAKAHKDTLSEANTRKLMGILLTTEAKFDEAKAQFGMSLILYKAVGDKMGQAASLSAIGMIHSRKGNLRGAHNCFTKALTLYEWFKHALGQLNCHQRLANLEKKLRDGDGLRGKNGQSSGHSHHYAATRRLQGDLNRKRNGEYIVRWVGHEMSLLLELPPSKPDKIQEAHAPSNVVTSTASAPMASDEDTSDSAAACSSPKATLSRPTSSPGVTNTPKKCRLGQIIDQREQKAANTVGEPNSVSTSTSATTQPPTNETTSTDAVAERLKKSSFARRKEYDASIRRTLSASMVDSSSSAAEDSS
ncbi:hypothetical protein Poli38472_006049 [Pythium oligandrum]|uniref:CHAT domain-containing protein n=1 Tax=Pythium oligandrum TaxID=41045 RepID=A0A8K1FMT0_PYTOL|nr:hypothetical protein Poli38472_006049 [Pythium oligandrum]|eukprot:TMW68581.1 hypothetical protein Poli38472_006049 [Pythium oligandrum]